MGPGLFDRWLRRCGGLIIRRASWIVAVSILLTFFASIFTVLLFGNLRTDLDELLPNTARSVVDLHRAKDRLRSTQSLAVLIFSKNTEASRRFVIDLAERIPNKLGLEIDRVEYRIDREIEFFRKNRALFIETKDLERIRDYVRDRIDYEKALHNPLSIFSADEIDEPTFDFGGLESKYAGKVSSFTRFKDGFYANADQTVRVALVYVRGAGGIGAALRVTRGVQEVIDRLNPKSYSPDMEVKFAGDVEDFVEEHRSLISDLAFSTVVVVVLVTAAMLIYYRELRMTFALVTSLFMGTLWTFGIAYFLVGYLNANSAFLGSIVIGNGINFGIIILARYLEFRRGGAGMIRSLYGTWRMTTSATLVAALAAGLSYGSLVMTTFRGFHQFGVIGLIGMLLCWLSAAIVMPALIVLIERFWRKPVRSLRRSAQFSSLVLRLVEAFPRAILVLSFLGFAFSCLSVARYRGEIIQTDTTKLRDRRSVQTGSVYLSRYLDEVFGRYITPLVILADTPSDRLKIEKRIKALKAAQGKSSLIANVYTLSDFVPPDQGKKLDIFEEIKKMLKPSIFVKLSDADRARVRKILPRDDLRPFGIKDLPPLVLDRFRLRNGKIGDIVIVEPVLDKSTLKSAVNQNRLISELRNAADQAKPGTPVVGTLPITVDMYQSVRRDGPKATALAFLSVVFLVLALFRRAEPVYLTLFSLVLGVSWLMGAVFRFDLQINFLNFIALPITFGIGVDYAVNIVQRYRSEGRGRISEAIRGTGGAVTLCSCTTIIGYGSLLLAGNQAFFSFGRLAILGEITTLSAAILSLPAYLFLRDRGIARLEKEVSARREEPMRRSA